MKAQDLDAGYYNPDNDRYAQQSLHDTRKPKITLVHLNQLKRMRASKQIENLVRRDILDMMYGSPPEEAAGGLTGL